MGTYGAGNAFDRRYIQKQTYVPKGHVNVRSTPAPQVKYEQTTYVIGGLPQPQQPKTSWLGVLLGGIAGFGMGLAGNKAQNLSLGDLNKMQQTPTTQQNGVNYKQNLIDMFGTNYNIVDDGNGQFRATDKNSMKSFGPATYDEMCKILGEQNSKIGDNPAVGGNDDDGKSKVGGNEGDNDQKLKGSSDGDSDDGKGGGVVSGGSGNANKTSGSRKTQGTNKTSSNEWTAEKKAKPYRLNMTVALAASGASSTATVVTPDGKTYKVNVSGGGSNNDKLNRLSASMQNSLKAAGWTNVTLENKNFNWSENGTNATGNVTKPQGSEQWTAAKKASYKGPLTISFAVRSGGYVGNSGSATVTTPDGKVHQVTTGVSLTAARARKDLASQMYQQLKADGWNSVQLQNNNFNDWQ